MRRFTSPLLVSAFALSLASCASVPSQDKLLSGIDKTQLAQVTTAKRVPTDPVCVDFYANVSKFQKSAQADQGKKNFLSRLGLNVITAVAVGQVVPTGISSQAGRTAAYVGAGSVASLGKGVAIRELSSSDRADAKVIEVADNIGCPVNIKP